MMAATEVIEEVSRDCHVNLTGVKLSIRTSKNIQVRSDGGAPSVSISFSYG